MFKLVVHHDGLHEVFTCDHASQEFKGYMGNEKIERGLDGKWFITQLGHVPAHHARSRLHCIELYTPAHREDLRESISEYLKCNASQVMEALLGKGAGVDISPEIDALKQVCSTWEMEIQKGTLSCEGYGRKNGPIARVKVEDSPQERSESSSKNIEPQKEALTKLSETGEPAEKPAPSEAARVLESGNHISATVDNSGHAVGMQSTPSKPTKMALSIPGTWMWWLGVAGLVITLLASSSLFVSVHSNRQLRELESKFNSVAKTNELSALERQIRENRNRAEDAEKALRDVEVQVERIIGILRGRPAGNGLINKVSESDAWVTELQKKVKSLNAVVEEFGGSRGIAATLGSLTNQLKMARAVAESRSPSGIWTISEVVGNKNNQTELQLAGIVVSGTRLNFSITSKRVQREATSPEITISSAKLLDEDTGFLLGEVVPSGAIADGGNVFHIILHGNTQGTGPVAAKLLLSLSVRQSERPRTDMLVRIIAWNSP